MGILTQPEPALNQFFAIMKPIFAMGHPELYVPHAGWFSHEPDDDVARFLSEGWFEYKEQAFLWLYLRPGDTFLDGGAHVGLYSVVAGRAMNNSGAIRAVEPHPASASLLNHNLQANGVTCAVVRQSALFSRSGPIALNAGGPGKSAYSSVCNIGEKVDALTVDAITLDDLLNSPVQLAKIDVEGAELEVLAGAADSIRRGLLPLLIIECTEANLVRFGATTESLFTTLLNSGYTVCRFDAAACQLVVRDYSGPIGYDNLFAAQHLEEVNRLLSTATEASRRIATDILTRGAAAEKLYLQGNQLEQLEQRRQSAEKCAAEAAQSADVAFRSLGEANWRAEQAEHRAEAADRRASEARSAVQESDRRAEESRKRAEEAALLIEASFRGSGEANWRAEQAEHRAEAAERRASEARSAVQESERRTEESRKRAEEAAQSTEAAFRSLGEANWRAAEAEKRAEAAAARVAEAHQTAEESERRAEAARQVAAQAEARTADAEKRADEARRHSEALLRSAENSLERLSAADIRVAQSENNAHQSRDTVLHYAELASRMRLRLNEMVESRYLRAGWKLGLTRKPAWLGNDEPAPAAPVETEMMRALRHLSEKKFQPRVVLDVGAGKGYWSILAGGYFKDAKFYLLDPLTENEPDLRRLCEQDPRQHYILTGVGEEPGERKIHVAADPDSSTMLLFPGDDDGRLRSLSVTTVDRLLEAGRIERPDLVKIDVQGMELQVLRGSTQLFDHTEVFVIEVNLFVFMPGCPRVHEIVQWMADRGYYLFDLAGSLRRPFEDDLGQLDLVMVSQKSPLISSNRWV
jgi:FkbM family methyltransferase